MRVLIHILLLLGTSFTGFGQSLKIGNFLQSFTDGKEAIVQISMDGNLQASAANFDNQSGGIANGALGISVQKQNVLWSGMINILSTADTISSGFGNIILIPQSGRGLTSGYLDVFHNELFKISTKPIGLHGYGSASLSNWEVGELTTQATVVGLGASIVNSIISDNGNNGSDSNSLYFGFEVGACYRGVLGNISTDSSLLEKSLGTEGNHFLGAEGGLKISFNKITASLQGYMLWDLMEGNYVPGVTSFQLAGGISVSGVIFQKTVNLP